MSSNSVSFERVFCFIRRLDIAINSSPPRLSSVSVLRVDEPTAVSRLMEWSVRLLQWERSSFVKWGMWRITRRTVGSLMSRPASRKHCMLRIWLRLSQPGPQESFGNEAKRRRDYVEFDDRKAKITFDQKKDMKAEYQTRIELITRLPTWRGDQIPDLRVFDSICIPQVQRTEERATRRA